MSSTVAGDDVQKERRSMRRSCRITMTTKIAAKDAPPSSSSVSAAAAGITVERISMDKRTSVDGVAAPERGGREIVVDLRRRSVEKTACSVAGLKHSLTREINKHRPERVTDQVERTKSYKSCGGAQLEQENSSAERVNRLTNRSKGSKQIRSATTRLPAVSDAKQVVLRATSLRQATAPCKETSEEVKLSKNGTFDLPPIKSSSAKTTSQPLKSFAVVSRSRSPNNSAKKKTQDSAGIQCLRGPSGTSKRGNSSVYPKPQSSGKGEETKAKQVSNGEHLMLAALTTDQTNHCDNQNDNQLLRPRIRKLDENMNEDNTTVRRMRRHWPPKMPHSTPESDTLPLECQPPVSDLGDEKYRVRDWSKYFSGKYRSTDKKLHRPVIGSICDIVTESSSEPQCVLSTKSAVRSVRPTQSRPATLRKDIEQSGVDADKSSSDECEPCSSINVCDATFVVESERDSSSEPLHARVDPVIAFTIAYDVDSSDCNSKVSTTPSNIASASVSSELVEINKSNADEVKRENAQLASRVRSISSRAPVYRTYKHSKDNISFSILSDGCLRDNSLLPPSSKLSSSRGMKSTTPRDPIAKSDVAYVREKSVKKLGERLRRVSSIADVDQSSISSVSSGSIDFSLNVADCVTSTPKLSPVSACDVQAYRSKSCKEFCGDDTHAPKTDDFSHADAVMSLRVHSSRKEDKRVQSYMSHDVEANMAKANHIAAGSLKKNSGVIKALHQQIAETRHDVRVRQNDGVCQSKALATVVGSVPRGADSDGRLNFSAQSLADNDDNFDFEPFDDENYLGSQLQLYRVSGAGEDLSSVKDGDMDVDDDVLLSSFEWLGNDSDDRLPPMSGELKSRTIRMLASRSDNCILPGAGEALSTFLPIEPRFPPEDVFFNWSFSSLCRPTSADSNVSQAAVISVERPSLLTTGAVINSISATSKNVSPPARCSDEDSARSADEDFRTERVKSHHQRDRLSVLDDVNGERRSRVSPSVAMLSLASQPTHRDVMVEPTASNTSRDHQTVESVDAASNSSEDQRDRQQSNISTPMTMRRRLPVLKSLNSSIRPPGGFMLSHSSTSLPEAVDDHDDRCIRVIVEMEKQVKETVIGYVADSSELHDAVAEASNGSSLLTAKDRPVDAQTPASGADKRQYVSSLIKAWNQQQPKSNVRPLSARSAGEVTAIRTPSVSVPKLSLGIPVHKTVGERQVNTDSPSRRTIATAKVGSDSARLGRNAGMSSAFDESVKSSSVPKVTETAGKLGRSVTLRSIADARQRVTQQTLQVKSVVSQQSPSRVLPPTQSRPPSNSKLSTALSPRSNAGNENGPSLSAVNKSSTREVRSTVGRQSFSAASSASTKLQIPSRKLSIPSSFGASELKRADALKSASLVNSSSLERIGGLGRPSKPGLNQFTSTVVRSQSKPQSVTTTKVQKLTPPNSIQAPVKQPLVATELQLQLSRCSSPSNESQCSVTSDKSGHSSVQRTTHSSLSRDLHTSTTSGGGPTLHTSTTSGRGPTFISNHVTGSQSARDHRSDKIQSKVPTTSSAAQLSICFSHQPDLVTNSIHSEQTATKLQQLELRSSNLDKQISFMRCSLRQRTLGFEAMLMLVKHLSEEASPVSVSQLQAQLTATNNLLTTATTKCDILVQQRNALISEIQNIKEDHEVQINALNVTHEMALHSIEERHEREVKKCLAQDEEKQKASVETLKMDHTRAMNDLVQIHRKTMADKEQEVTSKLIDLEFSHKRKIAELQRKHDGQVKEITAQFEHTKASLTAKVEQLKTECELIQRRQVAPVHPLSDSDERVICHTPGTPSASVDNMIQEIQSLAIVLDLRNSEINKLKLANGELEKQLKELPAAHETIQRLQQKLENAEAIVSMKVDFEKEMAEKHKMLIRMYDQESKDNKRLSMDNEQLMWRLTEEGLAPPPLTPNLIRRTISQPVPTKSAPGTPSMSRRKGLPSASSSTHRPFSQSEFDNFSAEDFVRDDEEYY